MSTLGVIGCGHWGGNYVRIFSALLGADRVVAVDSSAQALAGLRRRYGAVGTAQRLEEFLERSDAKMAVIATPAATHYELTAACLKRGLDVLAEKPLTLRTAEARKLMELAAAESRVLLVGHTFLYNPAVRKLGQIVSRGMCGDIYYMKATRTHLGLIRPDVNAVWDLAPHDVSIFNFLVGAPPVSVTADGGCYLRSGKEDVAFITLRYPRGILAHIHVSWADSNKERLIEVVGSRARAVFDDLNAMERVKLYKKGISANVAGGDNFGEFLFALRDGDIISPKIAAREPLADVCKDFLRSVRTRKPPFVTAEDGMRVVAVLCAVEESLKNGGRVTPVRSEGRRTPARAGK